MAPFQRVFFALISLICLSSVVYARPIPLAPCGGQPLRLIEGVARTVNIPGAENGNFMSVVGKPEIADFLFGPKNEVILVGKIAGVTNIILLDKETGSLICILNLAVGVDTTRIYIGRGMKSYTYECSKGPSPCIETNVKIVTVEPRKD